MLPGGEGPDAVQTRQPTRGAYRVLGLGDH